MFNIPIDDIIEDVKDEFQDADPMRKHQLIVEMHVRLIGRFTEFWNMVNGIFGSAQYTLEELSVKADLHDSMKAIWMKKRKMKPFISIPSTVHLASGQGNGIDIVSGFEWDEVKINHEKYQWEIDRSVVTAIRQRIEEIVKHPDKCLVFDENVKVTRPLFTGLWHHKYLQALMKAETTQTK